MKGKSAFVFSPMLSPGEPEMFLTGQDKDERKKAVQRHPNISPASKRLQIRGFFVPLPLKKKRITI